MDYSKITLIFRERAKLFTMRFVHPVSAKFIGQDCYKSCVQVHLFPL